ncbi:ATP-dependent zinc metalloprotease FtsH [Roseomonas nepalensis]|uniref:ATP-dependent zinc metalloprotease FtsH n=1 Tax=Muricoccus nepalensis TaxID=1854500 RepID=A0A502GE77_9PROT|nr:ATP-dependent zinc metalloprotease FtsH [Roseomonas nepalensis]TPG59838.1 ATP-dependent zinc metalloprotease FtsH [Roseomonas nepalensis]
MRLPVLAILALAAAAPAAARAQPALSAEQRVMAEAAMRALTSPAGPPPAAVPAQAEPKPRLHAWPGLLARWTAAAVTQGEAERMLADGRAESAYRNTWDGQRIYLTAAGTGAVTFFLPPSTEENQSFSRKARDAGVEFLVEDGTWADVASTVAKFLLVLAGVCGVLVFLFWLDRRRTRGPGRRAALFRKGSRREAGADGSQGVTFADVAGQDAAKESLLEVVEFLRDPKRFANLGARVPRGVLLEGDPGNGKTLLARAVAGEAGVPFFSASGSEFVEMYVGIGARRVRDLFGRARKHPVSIVFIDEIDVVGRARSGTARDGGSQEHDQTINQLLTELDGFDRSSTIVLIAATNRADVLDPALTRPGRIDRRVFVPGPDVRSREAILGVHARRVRLAGGVSLPEVASMTPGFSGADLANLLNEAAIAATRASKEAVDMEDLRASMDRILLGEKRPAGAMSEAERRVVAYHEAGHAIVAMRTPGADPVRRVTVVPRGRSLGAVVQTPDQDRHLWSRGLLQGRLAVTMGGRAAEEIILDHDEVTGGASGDIAHATKVAREMLGRYGMNAELGCVDLLGDGRGPGAAPATLDRLDQLVVTEIARALVTARAVLEGEIAALHALAQRLLAEETLTGEEARRTVDAAAPRPLAAVA